MISTHTPRHPDGHHGRANFRAQRRLAAIAAVAVASVLGLAACASAAPTKGGDGPIEPLSLDYSSSLGAGSVQSQLIGGWIQDVQSESDDQVAIKTYDSGSLLPPTDAVAGVADGRADIAMTSPQYTPGELPISTFTELPFATVNSEAFVLSVRDAYEDKESALRAEWNAQGLEVMIFVPAGSNTIVSKTPTTGVDDLKGLQVRAVGQTATALQKAGANPSAIPLPEVYESLERGLVDAVSSIAVEVAQDIGATETATYVADPGLGEYTIIPVFVNKSWWDSLPDATRQVFEDANDAYYDSFAEELSSLQAETCSELEEAGVETSVWDEKSVDELYDTAGSELWDAWAEVHSSADFDAAEFLDSYRERIEDHEAESSFLPTVAQCATT
jgi:TRAP-type C4-dicarboxylate transport system substrate-binding protein